MDAVDLRKKLRGIAPAASDVSLLTEAGLKGATHTHTDDRLLDD